MRRSGVWVSSGVEPVRGMWVQSIWVLGANDGADRQGTRETALR